jgi:hypothetical protein
MELKVQSHTSLASAWTVLLFSKILGCFVIRGLILVNTFPVRRGGNARKTDGLVASMGNLRIEDRSQDTYLIVPVVAGCPYIQNNIPIIFRLNAHYVRYHGPHATLQLHCNLGIQQNRRLPTLE